jgi:hypothetical protein
VAFDAPAVTQDVRDEDLATEELADEQRRDRALAASRIQLGPLLGIVRGVASPRGADRRLRLLEGCCPDRGGRRSLLVERAHHANSAVAGVLQHEAAAPVELGRFAVCFRDDA